MIGVELVKDRTGKEPAKKLCDALITRAYHNGLILLSCGQSTVRFMPPLVIDEGDVDEAIALLDQSLTEVMASEHVH
jgi:4-aminobutyrate aminotransferase